MIRLVHSCVFFHELSSRFDVVRVIFGIPKRVTSLCLPACSGIFSLHVLGGDVQYIR